MTRVDNSEHTQMISEIWKYKLLSKLNTVTMTREDNSEYTQMISEKLVEHILFSRFHTVTITRKDNVIRKAKCKILPTCYLES